MLFAVGGAAVECAFSGAYTLAQFAGWEWGKYRRPREAPRFTLAWLIFFALAFVIVETGVDPVLLTEYAVIFSVVALPLTYLPALLIARDRTFMGDHANGILAEHARLAVLRDHPGRLVRRDPPAPGHRRGIDLMAPDRMDLVYRILDDQLVDVDGRRCGRVDDLEFDGGPGEQLLLHAILSGSGTWHRRMPRALRTRSGRAFSAPASRGGLSSGCHGSRSMTSRA